MWRLRNKLSTSIVIACAVASWTFWPREVLSHETTTNTVLFDREIVRILNDHCVMCHTGKGLSFPLSTYEETWLQRRPIRAAALRRHMPPWPALPGYGQFINANSLTLREMQFLVSWVEGLGPRNAGTVFLNIPGSETRPQEVRAETHAGHWQLGEPDLTRQLAATTIPARQPDAVSRTVIDVGLTAERRIRGLEYMPGARRVVRAAFFTVEQSGQWIGSWTPWYGFVQLPPGVSYRLPAGARIVAEIHYRGAEEAVADSGTLGLFFADRASLKSSSDLVLEAKSPVPEAGSLEKFRAVTRLSTDTYVWSLRPEMLPGVKSIEVSSRRPDGGTDILLFAREPAVEWPTPYILKEPVLLRRGSDLIMTAYRDTGAARPQPRGIRLTVSRY